MEKNKLGVEFERAVRWLTKVLPESDQASRKPILFHDIRVGTYLYEQGYSPEVVLAGLLHDVLEWSTADEAILRQDFGDVVTALVKANTKNDEITDSLKREQDMVKRCAQAGQDALIVKAADCLDSFKWYSRQKNPDQLLYCQRIAQGILLVKPPEFKDEIFDELKSI